MGSMQWVIKIIIIQRGYRKRLNVIHSSACYMDIAVILSIQVSDSASINLCINPFYFIVRWVNGNIKR